MLRLQNKAFAGSLTPSGILNKFVGKLFTGTLVPTGTLTKQFIELTQLPGRIYHAIRRSNIWHAIAHGTFQSNDDGWSNGFGSGFGGSHTDFGDFNDGFGEDF